MNFSKPTPYDRKFSRDEFTLILNNALSVREFRFMRLAALNWLAVYPGDLPIRYLYAKALVNENRFEPTLPVLEELCQADPEFVEAVETKLRVETQILKLENPLVKKPHIINQTNLQEKINDTTGWLYSLGSQSSTNVDESDSLNSRSWSDTLKNARLALANHDSQNDLLDEAEQLLHQVLGLKPVQPLVVLTHLYILRAKVIAGISPSQALRSLAEHYQAALPNSLPSSLFLAESLMDGGEPEKAVSLLHQCAVRDITGQVSARLWGRNHPYQRLWPDRLEITLDIPIPASVAATLGWNQLSMGGLNLEDKPLDIDKAFKQEVIPNISFNTLPSHRTPDIEAIEEPALDSQLPETSTIKQKNINNDQPEISSTQPVHLPKASTGESADLEELLSSIEYDDKLPIASLPEILQPVKEELDRVGIHLRRPDLSQADARFPVYVVMTTWEGLVTQYGEENAHLLEKEILRLVSVIQSNRKWDAVLFYGDQGKVLPAKSQITDLQLANYKDPWKLKLALTDLDSTLRQAGEMIGALLIVGSPQIVPFHHLPNPTEDDDPDVPSDNPYGSRDGNYLVLEWPVGRLPGAEGKDLHNPGPLFQTISEIANRHQTQLQENKNTWYHTWLRSIFGFLHFANGNNGHSNDSTISFGYTAAAWRLASFSVFRQIGNPKKMLISPTGPFSRKKKNKEKPIRQYQPRGGKKSITQLEAKFTEGLKIPPAKLGYFNLHGTLDAVEWFGQVDPDEIGFGDAEKYSELPVALHPNDIGAFGNVAPLIVFSEACYSAHTYNRSTKESLALKFLQKGCYAFVGSTCTSYGYSDAPLVAADLLAYSFWNAIRGGIPAGEALKHAKLALAQEMVRRNGYLDGGDQKTLISFVLYGDPLAQTVKSKSQTKSALRSISPAKQIRAICDFSYKNLTPDEVNQQTLQYIKKVVEKYLPGMDTAEMSLKKGQNICSQKCQYCNVNMIQSTGAKSGAPGFSRKSLNEAASNHRIVILKQQDRNANSKNHRFARVTLDEKGNLVKLVMSR